MLLCYSQAYKNTKKPKKLTKNSKTQVIMMITINLYCKKISSLLISIISKQEPLMYGTTMNLGLIPTEYGERSSVLTSYFKVNECEKCKLQNKHHYGAHNLYLPELMGNASYHPQFCTKPRSTTKISTITYHWTGYSITHRMVIWIDTYG